MLPTPINTRPLLSKEYFLKRYVQTSIEEISVFSQTDPTTPNFMELFQNYPEIFSKTPIDPESLKKYLINPDEAISTSPTYPPKFINKNPERFQNPSERFKTDNENRFKNFKPKKDFVSLMTTPFEKILRSATKKKDINLLEKIWFYEDEKLGIQGPMSTQEMEEWFKEEKFPRSLKVAFGRKDKLFYLNKLYERFCGEIKEEELAVKSANIRMEGPSKFDGLFKYEKDRKEKNLNYRNLGDISEKKIEEDVLLQKKEELAEKKEEPIKNTSTSEKVEIIDVKVEQPKEKVEEPKETQTIKEVPLQKEEPDKVKNVEQLKVSIEQHKEKQEQEIVKVEKKEEVLEKPSEKVEQSDSKVQNIEKLGETIVKTTEQPSKNKKNKKKKGNVIDITQLIQEKKPSEKKGESPKEITEEKPNKPTTFEVKEEDFPTLPVVKPKVDDKGFIKVKKTTKNSKKQQNDNVDPVENDSSEKKSVNIPKNKSELQIPENVVNKSAENNKILEKEEKKPPKVENMNAMDFPSLEESKTSKAVPKVIKPVQEAKKKKKNLTGAWDYEEDESSKKDKKKQKKDDFIVNDENFPSLA